MPTAELEPITKDYVQGDEVCIARQYRQIPVKADPMFLGRHENDL